MNKYLVPELEKLEQYSAGELSLSRDDLHRSLKIIISLLGAQAVLPLWKEPALQLLVLLPFAIMKISPIVCISVHSQS